jgi:hypothetical protein
MGASGLRLRRSFAQCERHRETRMIEYCFEQGRLDEFLPEPTYDALSREERERFGRTHPAFMGGEYLPRYQANAVEIVRIQFRSTTTDVISVRARQLGRKITNLRAVHRSR